MNVAYDRLAPYYDGIYGFRDYRGQSEKLVRWARRFGPSGGNDWLDIACGTGHHLEYLSRRFRCVGVDASPAMLTVARRRLPSVRFVPGDMRTVRLGRKFSFVSCLFSSIGYMQSYRELRQALETFATHLRPGGVVFIEPWLTPDTFQPKGHLGLLLTHSAPGVRIARLNDSRRHGSRSIIRFQYLIAREGQPVVHLVDRHVQGLFTWDRTRRLMEQVGFRTRFFRRGLSTGRGLFVGVRRE